MTSENAECACLRETAMARQGFRIVECVKQIQTQKDHGKIGISGLRFLAGGVSGQHRDAHNDKNDWPPL